MKTQTYFCSRCRLHFQPEAHELITNRGMRQAIHRCEPPTEREIYGGALDGAIINEAAIAFCLPSEDALAFE